MLGVYIYILGIYLQSSRAFDKLTSSSINNDFLCLLWQIFPWSLFWQSIAATALFYLCKIPSFMPSMLSLRPTWFFIRQYRLGNCCFHSFSHSLFFVGHLIHWQSRLLLIKIYYYHVVICFLVVLWLVGQV